MYSTRTSRQPIQRTSTTAPPPYTFRGDCLQYGRWIGGGPQTIICADNEQFITTSCTKQKILHDNASLRGVLLLKGIQSGSQLLQLIFVLSWQRHI